MALKWDLKDCDQSACWDADGKMTQTCQSLIWATMVVGLDSLTEKNVDEWVIRLNVDHRLIGTFSAPSEGINVEMLKPFYGIKTNATPLTRAKYLMKACDFFVRIIKNQ